MQHGVTVIKDGAIIRKSRNLRGMLDYARKSHVVRIFTAPFSASDEDKGGTVLVQYADGATCRGNFESYAVMLQWCRARRIFSAAEWADRNA